LIFWVQPKTKQMKKVISLIAFLFVFIQLSFPQLTSIKDYPLKDYIAPDIKYQMLDLGTNLNLIGSQIKSDNGKTNDNHFDANLDLDYYLYQNISRFQGISDARFQTLYQYQKRKYFDNDDTVSYRTISSSIGIDYYGQNRLYFDNSVFIGLNGYLTLNRSQNNREQVDFSIQRSSFSINPYLSVGKGRIQPIQSAREAMDVLLSMQKCNRLALLPDTLMIDSLAQVANRIRFKRFYDLRLKDIYQLEQLDHAIQAMNLVDTADIVYFAHLNDIWNFTQNFKRGSGIRYEGGIIPTFHYYYYNYNSDSENSDNSTVSNVKWYGLFGFFSFTRMQPVSYAWQSDLMLDITFGILANDQDWKNRFGESIDTYQTNLTGMVNAGWQFGLYPNTRTYAGLTPFAAVSFMSNTDFTNDEFGLNTGLVFDAYYYVSPRLRLSIFANVFYNDSFDQYIPSPFWNNPVYTSNNAKALQSTNDVITNPIDAQSSRDSFRYSFSFTLTYAIF